MPAEDKVDVLIIGAGPAGLTCALGLLRARLGVRIVDKRAVRVLAGHADGIMPRTTEVFQSYGLGNAITQAGHHCYKIANYNYSAASGGIECGGRVPMINEPSARFRFCVTLHQGFVEKEIGDALHAGGLKIERPARPTALEISSDEKQLLDPTSYPVKVHLNDESENNLPEVVYAKFVVGADGARSFVREALKVPIEGEDSDHIWGVIDFVPSPESNFPDFRLITTVNSKETGIMLIPREDGKIRLYIEVGDEDDLRDPATGKVDLTRYSAEKMLEIVRKAFHPYILKPTSPDEIEWWTLYTVGQRVAARFSVKDRVFIAGDACHTHSPKGGQGLNVSVNDSHNLSWKLAYVLRNWADLSLLRTYEFERRVLAQELIAFDKWFAEGFSAKARAKLVADDKTVELPGPLEAWRQFSALTSGIGICYAPSRITVPPTISTNVEAGKSIPSRRLMRLADYRPYDLQDALPSDMRFKIVAFVGEFLGKDDAARVKKIASQLRAALSSFPREATAVVTVAKAVNETTVYTDFPVDLHPTWESVFVDYTDIADGKSAYEYFGIGENGAFVVVRPDGYVGTVCALGEADKVAAYFKAFLN